MYLLTWLLTGAFDQSELSHMMKKLSLFVSYMIKKNRETRVVYHDVNQDATYFLLEEIWHIVLQFTCSMIALIQFVFITSKEINLIEIAMDY